MLGKMRKFGELTLSRIEELALALNAVPLHSLPEMRHRKCSQ